MVAQEGWDASMQAKLMQHDHVKVTSMPNAITTTKKVNGDKNA